MLALIFCLIFQIIDNKKVETAKVYAKSCEDSIAAIDQTLR